MAREDRRIALIVGLGGPLIAALGALVTVLAQNWLTSRTQQDAKEVPAVNVTDSSWQFEKFNGGRVAADWISRNCIADPSYIYATLIRGDTFFVWCKPASNTSEKAVFTYTSVEISPTKGAGPPPPYDRAHDIPVSMGGQGYGYFLLFRKI